MTGLQIVNDMQPESVRPSLSLACREQPSYKLQATPLTLPESITTPLLQLVEERENAIKRGTDGSNEGKQDDADISDSFQVLTKKRQQSLKLATDIWAEYVKLVPGNKTPRETFEAYKKRCVPVWLCCCCCSLVAHPLPSKRATHTGYTCSPLYSLLSRVVAARSGGRKSGNAPHVARSVPCWPTRRFATCLATRWTASSTGMHRVKLISRFTQPSGSTSHAKQPTASRERLS